MSGAVADQLAEAERELAEAEQQLAETKTRLEAELESCRAQVTVLDKASAVAKPAEVPDAPSSVAGRELDHDDPSAVAAAPNPYGDLTPKETFAAVGPEKKTTVATVVLVVKKPVVQRKWVTDRYSGQYHVRESDKDKLYLHVDVDITSKDSFPKLPQLGVYRAVAGGVFELVGTLSYEFRRWDDYGSFLGNYRDIGNAFEKRDTVKFSAGVQILRGLFASHDLVVAASTSVCVAQTWERFRRPALRYEVQSGGCAPSKIRLSDVGVTARVIGKLKRRRR